MWLDPFQCSVLLTVIGLHLALALATFRESFIRVDGRIYALLADDQYISMVYARNLTRHGQLVWSDGQHVEGFSNPLWTFLMAASHGLPLPARLAALPILLLDALLLLVTALLGAFLARRITAETGAPDSAVPMAMLAAGACVLLNYTLLVQAAVGCEGPLGAVLLLSAWLCWEPAARRRCALWAMGVFLVLACTVRAEMGPFLIGFLAVAVCVPAWRRRALWGLLFVGSAMAALTLARVLYFGDWLPNTYFLKVLRFPHRWINGVRYMLGFLFGGGGLVLLGLGALVLKRSPCAQIATLCAGLFVPYIACLGGDAFPLYRLYVPIFPLLAATASAGLAVTLARSGVSRPAGLVLASLVLIGATNGDSYEFIRQMFVRRLHRTPAAPAAQTRENILMAQWLNTHTPAGARIAVFAAGAIAYFCDRPIVDMLGKCERYIARLPARGGHIPGHNKYDFDFVADVLQPEYILGERPSWWAKNPPPPLETLYQEDFGFVDALVFSPAVQRRYQPLAADYPGCEKRTLYVRICPPVELPR